MTLTVTAWRWIVGIAVSVVVILGFWVLSVASSRSDSYNHQQFSCEQVTGRSC